MHQINIRNKDVDKYKTLYSTSKFMHHQIQLSLNVQ